MHSIYVHKLKRMACIGEQQLTMYCKDVRLLLFESAIYAPMLITLLGLLYEDNPNTRILSGDL